MKNIGFYQVALLVMVLLAASKNGIALAKTEKEIYQSRQNQKLCKKWKAGKPLQWPSDCNSVGSKKCRKLCNSQMIENEEEKVFPSGLYYVQPNLDEPGGRIQILNGIIPSDINFTGGQGFDVSADFIATVKDNSNSQMSYITLWMADGSTQHVTVAPGLYNLTRPSLSPDATRVAVQATETLTPPLDIPQFFSIYIIELSTGKWTRLVPLSSNPYAGNELPEWFPSGDRIAHQGVEADCQIIRVYDVITALPVLTIRNNGTTGCYQPINGVQDGPRFHFAVSRDSSKLLIVGEMQIYNANTGSLISDIHQKVLDALFTAGYKPDARFPGQGGGGTFPLDGTFSPDGTKIVFDGAVQKDGVYGVLLMQVNTDGTGFTILKGPIDEVPEFSNNHNYSQVNPVWK